MSLSDRIPDAIWKQLAFAIRNQDWGWKPAWPVEVVEDDRWKRGVRP